MSKSKRGKKQKERRQKKKNSKWNRKEWDYFHKHNKFPTKDISY